ncbi:MAG TPA: hypothetical protein PKX14_14245 [Thauera aminoaromatica]|nr:hypothetical protein [Thauera aminoaromatica]
MGPLLVHLLVSPAFAEVGTAPSITLEVHCEAAEAMVLKVPKDDVCLVVKLLQATLANPAGKAQAPAACTNEELVEVRLEPGGDFSRRVELAKVWPGVKWGAGQWELDLGWNDALGTKIGQLSTPSDPLVRAKALQTFTVKARKTVKLDDGTTFEFQAHGHKRTMEGQRSPLIIVGAVKGEDFSVNLVTEEERVFEANGRVFELIEWKYDESMKLRYFGRVKWRDD